MPDFSVAVNIRAKLGQGFNSTFRGASRLAESTSRRISAAGRSASRGLGTLSGAMDRAAASRSLQVGAIGAVAAMTKAVHTAVRLEDSMLDLRKTAGDLGDVEFKNLTRMLEGYAVSGRTKARVEELYATASSLAQVGFAKGGADFLLDWTKLAGRAATAFDITADSAAEGLSKTVAALGADKSLREQYDMASSLADAYNHLSNNMGSTAPQLLQFNQRVAGQAKGLGLNGALSAAWGSALISMGTRAEVAATAFNSMTVTLLNLENESQKVRDGMEQLGFSGEQLKRMFARDAQGALLQIMKRLSQLDKQTRTSLASQIFGREHGDEIAKFTGSIQKYEEALALVRNETVYLGSATQEANARLSGMGAKLQKTRNQLTLTAKEAGTALFPIVERGLSVITPALKGISSAIEKTPALGDALGVTAAVGGVGALALGVKKLFVGLGGAKMAGLLGKGVAKTAGLLGKGALATTGALATPAGATLALTAAVLALTTLLARKGYNALGGGEVTPAEKDKIKEEEAEKPTGILRGSPRSDARFGAKSDEPLRSDALIIIGKWPRRNPLDDVATSLKAFPGAARSFAEGMAEAKEGMRLEKAAKQWYGFPGTVERTTERGMYQWRQTMGALFDPGKEPMSSLAGAVDKAAPLGSFAEAIEKMRTAGIDPVRDAGSQTEQAASLVGSTAFGASQAPYVEQPKTTPEPKPERMTPEEAAGLSRRKAIQRQMRRRLLGESDDAYAARRQALQAELRRLDATPAPTRGPALRIEAATPTALHKLDTLATREPRTAQERQGPTPTQEPSVIPEAVAPAQPTDLTRVLDQLFENAWPTLPHQERRNLGDPIQLDELIVTGRQAADGPTDVSDQALLAAAQESNRLLAELTRMMRERQHRRPFFDTGGVAPA